MTDDNPDTGWESRFTEIRTAGSSYLLQENFRRLGRFGRQVPVTVVLRCEPENDYDSNAVRVEADGIHVDYIHSYIAQVVSPRLHVEGGTVTGRGIVMKHCDYESETVHLEVLVWLHVADAERLGFLDDRK